jgi:serine/threonine protein kinase/CHASE2 domain-containing sensor protein
LDLVWQIKSRLLPTVYRQLKLGLTIMGKNVVKQGVAALVAAGSVLALREIGLFQGLELSLFSWVLQTTTHSPAEKHILVITVSEEDLSSTSNNKLNRALDEVSQHDPAVIGVHLPSLRFFPDDNLLTTCTLESFLGSGSLEDKKKIPEGIFNIGFSNLLKEKNGQVHRNVLSTNSVPTEDCNTPFSFSYLLVNRYFQQKSATKHLNSTQAIDSSPRLNAYGELEWGGVVIKKWQRRSGGYQFLGSHTYETFLPYQDPTSIDSIQLGEIFYLGGQGIQDKDVKGKIIIFGVADNNWKRDYRNKRIGAPPEVFTHALMVSQLLSIIENKKPQVSYWNEAVEIVWIIFFALVSWIIGTRVSHISTLILLYLAASTTLLGIFFVAGLYLLWIPVVAPGITLLAVGLNSKLYQKEWELFEFLLNGFTKKPLIKPEQELEVTPLSRENLELTKDQASQDTFIPDPQIFKPESDSAEKYDQPNTAKASYSQSQSELEGSKEGSTFIEKVPHLQTGTLFGSKEESTFIEKLPSMSESPETIVEEESIPTDENVPTQIQEFPGSKHLMFRDPATALKDSVEIPAAKENSFNKDNSFTQISSKPSKDSPSRTSWEHSPVKNPMNPILKDPVQKVNNNDAKGSSASSPHRPLFRDLAKTLKAGTLLSGRYEILSNLGRGGQGHTYKAVDTQRPGKPYCAVKQLINVNRDEQQLQIARKYFQQEAEILENLGKLHEQIPSLLAYFEEDGEFYLVQEFIQGHPLEEELIPYQHLPLKEVMDLLESILSVLSFVHHRNVIHRDVKPSNILRRSSDQRLFLIDFGSVKQLEVGQGKSIIIIGTQGYCPIEQWEGNPKLSSDVYSAGIIGLQALTGQPVTDLAQMISNENISSVASYRRDWHQYVPFQFKPLIDFLDRMVAYQWRDRYVSAVEALRDLQRIKLEFNHYVKTLKQEDVPPSTALKDRSFVSSSDTLEEPISLLDESYNQTSYTENLEEEFSVIPQEETYGSDTEIAPDYTAVSLPTAPENFSLQEFGYLSSISSKIVTFSASIKRVSLNLGEGGLRQGYSHVIAEVWTSQDPRPQKFIGYLPVSPQLIALHQKWRSQYLSMSQSWRSSLLAHKGVVSVFRSSFSLRDFEYCSDRLTWELNQWLKSEGFRSIDQQLRTHLKPEDEIHFILESNQLEIRRLPWSTWSFLKDYPRSEISLSTPSYSRTQPTFSSRKLIRILAILGDSTGVDLSDDQQVLDNLPQAETIFLVEPTRLGLEQNLWHDQGWDIIFFAGHSVSYQEDTKACIYINPHEVLSISQLKQSLRKAVERGLKLAIFNSCDGLGIAYDMEDLNIPHIILMKELVPNRVAQLFLRYFMGAYVRGESIYLSLREARERLVTIQDQFPTASWIPVLCQNPAEQAPYWHELLTSCTEQNPPVVPEHSPIEEENSLVWRDGSVEIDSLFYVEREPIESDCYREILRSGALISIKAPDQMGKTSLLNRIIHYVKQQQYREVVIDLQITPIKHLADLDKFLRWFCAVISKNLRLESRVSDLWEEDIFGSVVCAESYFEEYILTNINEPLVLAIDRLDRIFEYPEIAEEFLSMLRSWHEYAKSPDRKIWQKIRLILIYSTEGYVRLDVNRSPFNVGLTIKLPEFTESQITQLALVHGLKWTQKEASQLMNLVGGHPYLVRRALYCIAGQGMKLSHFLEEALTEAGPYQDHLTRLMNMLQVDPQLVSFLRLLLENPSELGKRTMNQEKFRLQSLGLVSLEGNSIKFRCELYKRYFMNVMSQLKAK